MPGHDRGVLSSRGVRWIAGLGLAGAGALAAVVGLTRVKDHLGGGLHPNSEFTTGRGERQGPVNRKSRKAGYELEDANVRSLVMVMVVSVALIVGGVVVVFLMYNAFDYYFVGVSRDETPQQRARIVPPLPHLQADPYRELDATIMEQKQRLTTYGYGGSGGKEAHIPIQRAMRQIVGKSLDAAAQADAGGAPGSSQPVSALPDYNAALPLNKPANRIPGEGRPGAVAPGFDPAKKESGGSK